MKKVLRILQGYGSEREVDRSAVSAAAAANTSLIRRFNHHSTMVLRAADKHGTTEVGRDQTHVFSPGAFHTLIVCNEDLGPRVWQWARFIYACGWPAQWGHLNTGWRRGEVGRQSQSFWLSRPAVTRKWNARDYV